MSEKYRRRWRRGYSAYNTDRHLATNRIADNWYVSRWMGKVDFANDPDLVTRITYGRGYSNICVNRMHYRADYQVKYVNRKNMLVKGR